MFKRLQRKITSTLRLLLPAIFLICIQENLHATGAASIPHGFTVIPGAPTIPAFPATGNVNIFALAAPHDEWDSLIAPTNGFNFTFAGVAYTKIVVSTNGWVALCPANTQTLPPVFIGNSFPNNLLDNNTTGYPILAPLWDDLAASVITYNWATPNVVWIRWTVKWDKTNATTNSLFYLKLDGATGIISFYYTNNPVYIPATPSASIGICGVITGDYYSANSTSANTAYVDSMSENTDIGMGTSLTTRPYNVVYEFTPRLSTGISTIEMLKPEVFPVPAREEITVKYTLKTTSGVRIQIIDQLGKVIYTERVDAVDQFNDFHKKLDDIVPGIYYISILATKPENRFETASFIKY